MAHFNNNGNNNTTTTFCYCEKGWGGPEWAVTLLERGWQYGGCVPLLFLGILTLLYVSCVVQYGCSRLFLCIFSCREWEIYLWIIWFCLTSFLPEVILLSLIQTLSYFFSPLSCDASFSFFKCYLQIPIFLTFRIIGVIEMPSLLSSAILQLCENE